MFANRVQFFRRSAVGSHADRNRQVVALCRSDELPRGPELINGHKGRSYRFAKGEPVSRLVAGSLDSEPAHRQADDRRQELRKPDDETRPA